MKQFREILRNISSSPYHQQMVRFAAPLNDHFGINHFWYYKITSNGHYSYFGSHGAWNEYAMNECMLSQFSCLRHPKVLQKGIHLMKATEDKEYNQVLGTAWEKYRINFNINLINPIQEGVEAFGFGSRFNDPCAEQRLLNELPLLYGFINAIREKYGKLFHLLDDNMVDLSEAFGSVFYERPKGLEFPYDRDRFLKEIGLLPAETLTPREKGVLKFVMYGYPAGYIASQLNLSRKTVENYLATIKSKLGCNSKVELIRKSQKLSSMGYFN